MSLPWVCQGLAMGWHGIAMVWQRLGIAMAVPCLCDGIGMSMPWVADRLPYDVGGDDDVVDDEMRNINMGTLLSSCHLYKSSPLCMNEWHN